MTARMITSVVTLMVLVALVIGGVYYGFRELTAPFPSLNSEPEQVCETVPGGSQLSTDQVVVSVYNASDRSGFASTTLTRLERRGFQPGSVGNAPTGTSVRRVEVWAQDVDDPAAQLVARQFGRRTEVVQKTEPLGPGPDVVLGPRARKLKKAPRQITVDETRTECRPAESPAP
ncbi:LytR C-terminal domain-containing protein [Nocardioidaceae bacterium]|nr:LytR C-terminal domain-containing protein [Nocardioidaceae bacterium]